MQTYDLSELARRLTDLRAEHRQLDQQIELAIAQPVDLQDDLAIKRWKKRKLKLRDLIARAESLLIPDEPA